MLFIFFNDSSSSLLKYNSSVLTVSVLSLSMYLTLFFNSNDTKLLMTIPGVNFYTAAGILSEIGTINRFDNKLKFASYTGLIPGEYSSGEKR